MLIARLFQSAGQRFLVRTPHKSEQGLDHLVHVIQLMRLQSSQTGRDLHILRIATNALQIRDHLRQLLRR